MNPTSTIQVGPTEATGLLATMRSLQASPRIAPEGFYSVKVEADVAMLVEPVNGTSYVFVPPCTVHRFESDPSSGAHKLRQRIAAEMVFTMIVRQAQTARPGVVAEIEQTTSTRPRRMP